MTGTTNGTAAPLRPIPNLQRTLWSKDYLRLRAISLIIGIPTRILLTLSYYLKDPLTLRKYQVTRRSISIPSREKGRYIKAILYEPINREKKPLPVHINWHGSGFVIPCLGVDTTFCAHLVSNLGCIVLDCDYRKAPAHPFPAGPNDAEDMCLYVHAHPELYDTSKISIGGTSAGGNLALGAAAKLGPNKIQAVCCIAPAIDLRSRTSPKQAYDPGRHRSALPFWASRYFVICYLAGVDVKRDDPLVSPYFAKTEDFPSTVYIATGTGDTLYWDGKGLVDRLTQEGHPSATFRPAVGMGHAPHRFDPSDPSNLPFQMYQDIVNNIRRSWSQPTRDSKL